MALAAPQCLDGLRLGLPEEWESHPTTSGRDELIRALAVTSGWDGEEQKTVRATPVRFNGAFSNHVYLLHLHCHTGRSRKFLLRIYGQADADKVAGLVCKADEVAAFTSLSRASLGPALVATFANGRVESWIEGRAITNARRWLRLMDESYTGGDVPPAIREALGAPSGAAALAAEGAWLERLLGSVPQDTFCHNDLQHGNIMELAGDGPEPGPALCFVDYEYSCYGPAQYDVANHFAEWAYDYADPEGMMDFRGRFPTAEQRSAFVEAYLRARALQCGPEAGCARASGPSEEGVREFLDAADCFLLVVHLVWVVWGLVQAKVSSVGGFDYGGYAAQRIAVYAQDKAALLQGGEVGTGGAGNGVSSPAAGVPPPPRRLSVFVARLKAADAGGS